MRKFCDKCQQEVNVTVEADGSWVCNTCGTVLDEPGLTPGKIVDGFEIIRELGRGANGIVYRARQIKLEREVALKILPYSKARDKGYVEDFFREARSAAKINHPAIVLAYDGGVSTEGIYFLAMELINGETLEQLVNRSGPVDYRIALKMAQELAEGLEYAWRTQKLTHGDIKPANIMIDAFGKAKLADLGLAKTASESYGDELMATPMYAAPEVCKFEFDRIGYKSDMYSYASTVYYMLIGEPPFNEDDPEKVMQMQIEDEPTALIDRMPILPPEISYYIGRMLSKNPDDRPESWGDVVEFLRKCRSRLAVHKVEPEKSKPEKNRKSPLRWLLPLIIFLALAGGGGILLLNRKAPEPPKPLQQVDPALEHERRVASRWRALQDTLKQTPAEDQQLILLEKFLSEEKPGGQIETELVAQIKTLQEKIQLRKKDSARQAALMKKLSDDFAAAGGALELKGKSYADLEEIQRRLKTFAAQIAASQYSAEAVNSPVNTQLKKQRETLQKLIADERRTANEARYRYAEKEFDRLTGKQQWLSGQPLPQDERRDRYFERLTMVIKHLPLDSNPEEEVEGMIPAAELSRQEGEDQKQLSFLRRQLVESRGLVDVLINNKDKFKDQEIPWETSEANTMTVQDIDQQALQLGRVVSQGAMFRSRIRWNTVKMENYNALLEKWLLPLPPNAISPEDWSLVAGWLLRNRQWPMLKAVLLAPKRLPAAEVPLWQRILDELPTAPQEMTVIQEWKLILNKLREKEYQEALRELTDFVERANKTFSGRYYLPQAKMMINAMLWNYPELQGHYLWWRGQAALQKKQLERALADCSTALARYQNDPKFPALVKSSLQTAIAAILREFPVSSNFRALENRQLTNPPPGNVAAWLQAHRRKYSGDPKLVTALGLTSDLDLGNWSRIELNFRKKLYTLPQIDQVRGEMQLWQNSLFYDYGITGWQYGDLDTARQAQVMMQKYLSKKSSANAQLMIAYSLAIRNYAPALKLGREWWRGTTAEQLRIRIGRLLLLAQNPEYGEQEFSAEVNSIQQQFAKSNFSFDLKALDLLRQIYCGQTNQVTESLRFLMLNSCHSREWLSMLLADVTARDLLLDRKTVPVRQVLKKLEDSRYINCYAAPLWYRTALLKLLSSGPSVIIWRYHLTSLWEDSEIAAQAAFPKLVILKCWLQLMSGELTIKDVTEYYPPYLEALPMASSLDRDLGKILSSTMPEVVMSGYESWFKKDMDAIYWLWLTAIVAEGSKVGGNPDTISQNLGKHPYTPLWQERLLERDLLTLLKASRAYKNRRVQESPDQ